MARVACLALLLVACQSAPAPGATCTRSADCASPLSCRHGRCRTECREARDCPPGLRCFLDASGVGACSIPSEDRCITLADCDNDLVCDGAQCRTTCTNDAACGAGGTCQRGSCITPVSGGTLDAGPNADGGRPLVGTGSRCNGGACAVGYECTTETEHTSVPVCRKLCTSDAECLSEGLGSFCQTGGHCTTACDPAASTSTCGEEACGYYTGNPPAPEPMVDYTDCRPIGAGREGDPCTVQTDCGVTLWCLTDQCRRLCHPSMPAPAECTGGYTCHEQSTIVNGTSAAYGVCCSTTTGC